MERFYIHRCRVGLFFNQIPLVQGNNQSLSPFLNFPDNLHILPGKSFGNIHNQYADITVLNGFFGADQTVIFNGITDAGPFPESCRIHNLYQFPVIFERAVNTVTRGTGDVGDNVSFHAQKALAMVDFPALGIPRRANLISGS